MVCPFGRPSTKPARRVGERVSDFGFDQQGHISLQRELRPGDSALLQAHPEIHPLGHQLTDFADGAALCRELDLVICVDTAIAHLCGALGVPVWIVLPFAADWRWLRRREDSPWYDSAHLFRQPQPGDWAGALASVVQQLTDTLVRTNRP